MMMDKNTERKVAALTIAGSDSGGNAGIQADLRAFQMFGIHGCTVITALTAQNPFEVKAVLSADADFVRRQIETVIDVYDISALKTGMLCTSEIISAVADLLTCQSRIIKVFDPVMVATSGARLLEDNAVEMLQKELLPLADLITPNLPEAEILLNSTLASEESVAKGAKELFDKFGCAVLIKGGHGSASTARDFLHDGSETLWLESPCIEAPLSVHGTGCSLSAAITASLACGRELQEAVVEGKAYIYESIRTSVNVGECAAVLGTPQSLPMEAITINTVED